MPLLKKFFCCNLGRANMYISILVWLGTCISEKDITILVLSIVQIAMCTAHAYLSKKDNRMFCVPYMLWFIAFSVAVPGYIQFRYQTITYTAITAAVVEPFAIFYVILIYSFYQEGDTAGNRRTSV